MKEHERHIADTSKRDFVAWCGESITGWAFVDVDHAALNARLKGRLLPCPACLAVVRKAFDEQENV